jgi:hypothetical protein
LIGLLALLAFLFYNYQVRKMEQSVRHTIEGESPGLFNAAQVVDILRTFETPESRFLESFIHSMTNPNEHHITTPKSCRSFTND